MEVKIATNCNNDNAEKDIRQNSIDGLKNEVTEQTDGLFEKGKNIAEQLEKKEVR